ncbi:MAG: hypothetical protein Q7S87_16430 [Agitococcus sp.]|nr:hypothetical protein [Agitococcus sp.]MDO9176966.1 hypothetical protein [Agitococcus sp.]
MNIFSGEIGLGAALTNPTELAKHKGGITCSYPVVVSHRRFPDAEAAYHFFKLGTAAENDRLMVTVLVHKLRQHPRLLEAITQKGGEAFLRSCTHLTNSTRNPPSTWEGVGVKSRFIQALVESYVIALAGGPPPSLTPQGSLFD